jgi:MinD superfamily P-loop ATPase
MKEIPVIDQEKCQGCGLCVEICNSGALILNGNTVRIQAADRCGWCTLCELVCPYGAISCPFEIVIEGE